MNVKELRKFLNNYTDDAMQIVLSTGDHQYRLTRPSIQTAEVDGRELYEYNCFKGDAPTVDVVLFS